MKREWMAEVQVDIGDPKVGATLDKLDEVSCPEGHGVMDRTADERQTHIWYEVCRTCDGMYFDAGEVTDLKYDTFMDRVRDVIKGKRPNR